MTCSHGHIALCCPHNDCPTRIAAIDQHYAALEENPRAQWEAVLEYALKGLHENRTA